MKKIYAALALALAVSATAGAKVNPSEMKASKATGMQEMNRSELVAGTTSDMKKAPAKAQVANKVSDLYGYYRYATIIGLTGHEGVENSSVELSKSETEGNIVVTGLCYGFPVEAQIDSKTFELTFKEQVLFYNSYYKKDVYLKPYRWNDSGEGMHDVDAVKIPYYPEGFDYEDQQGNTKRGYIGWFVADTYDILGAVISTDEGDGYFAFNYFNHFQPMNEYVAELGVEVFEFNPYSWKEAGKAAFTDGWLAPVFSNTGSLPAYEVPVYQNVHNPHKLLLKNPYGKGTPFEEVNDWADQDGYIVFNVQNQECVLVYPLVPSGFNSYNLAEGQVTCSNMEGELYYLEKEFYVDIEEELEWYELESATLDSNGVVTLPNCLYSPGYDVLSYGTWTDANDEAVDMVSIIELPEELLSGVEGMVDDVNVATKRYFNLQGMETAPVKGQIVIVKEGNKSYKQVVR